MQVKVNEAVAREARSVLKDLGMDLDTATEIFYRKIVRCGCIPFNITLTDDKRVKGGIRANGSKE